jgi:hypothetical protein
MVELRICRAVLGVFLALSARGQTQKYSIHGTVRNEVTREPVKNALVVLEEVPASDPSASSVAEGAAQPQSRALFTDAAGAFHFEGLSKGQYTCIVRKPGYDERTGSGDAQTFALPSSSAEDGVDLNLTPLGAIEGRVLNQYDEPLETVVLDIYRSTIFDGEKRISNVGTAWTDDLGSYHLAYLPPGKYYVKAQARRGGTVTHSGVKSMRYGPWEAFTPLYFGGATGPDSATPIIVTAGARVRADFRLDVQPSFRIRGKLDGYVAQDAVNFELVQTDNRTQPSRALLNVTTGEFEIMDVPPGNHKLRAVQGGILGEIDVQVGDGDVSGVTVSLQPSLTISVSMHSVTGEDAPAARASCQVMLFQQQSEGPVAVGTPDGNGKFTIPGLFPGEYLARIRCFGGYPQSATFGGAELLENPVIKISAAPLPPMDVRFKPGGGTLNVKFEAQVSRPAVVLVVPGFSPSAGPVLHPAGAVIPNLAPGDYMVYGLAQYEDAEFRNPAFLETLSAGTKVHMEDGKTAEVTIASVSQ